MNPFAYDLNSTFREAYMLLDVDFMINAPFKEARVYAVETESKEKYPLAVIYPTDQDEFPLKCGFQNLNLIDKGLPMGKDFTWCVEVEALNEHEDVRLVSNEHKLYSPTSVDIDNNPENENFGTVFCIEARNEGKTDPKYLSSYGGSSSNLGDGAGLYVFDADGTPRPIPNQLKERYGYNGGDNRVFNKNQSTTSFPDDFSSGCKAFNPYRVRVSEDGRIFVSSLRPDGQVLWEVDKRVFSRPNDSKWGTYTAWSRVMAAARSGHPNENANTFQRNGNLYTASSGGNFIAGPNVGFDVRGAGDKLQLLMLSGSTSAICAFAPSGFRCDEYNLGTNPKWEKKPTSSIFEGGSYVINYQGTQVLYDKKGDVWLSQHRANNEGDYPTLMKFSSTGAHEIDNPHHLYRRCGAMRFNKDFTKFAITSKGSGSGGALTLYSVDSEGNPILTNAAGNAAGVEYNMVSQTGVSHMDYAWDYADNLYVACDGSDGRCIAIYAMPNTGRATVSTPCASKYAFSTKYSVAWKNLFLHEQDISDPISPYSDVNIRLYRLLQVEYNEYRLADKGVVYNGENELDQSNFTENRTENSKNLLNVANYFKRDDSSTRLGDFLQKDNDYAWLGDYISGIAGIELNTLDRSTKYTEDFINRQGYFTEKGKPESWRPIWVKEIFGLNDKIAPNEYLPIQCDWEEADCFSKIWISGWSTADIADNNPLLSNTSRPALWYKFNTVDNLGLNDHTHILAWREEGVDGPIVVHVNNPNAELYATYVEKKLDENDDPNPNLSTNPYDATNDDLIKLLNNKNYVQDKTKVPTHNLTVARKLQAGMYNTICLPLTSLNQDVLDLTTLGNTHPLYSDGNGQGATVLDFASVSSAQSSSGEDMTILNFTQVSAMQAGKPYLVKPKDGAEDLVTDMEFSTVSAHDELHPAKAEANGVTFTFVPTINPTKVPAGSLILVADNRLALTTKDGQMAGMRGYFTFSGLSAIDEEAIAEQAAEGRVLLNIKRPTATSVTVAPDSEKQNAPEVRKLMQDNQIYIIRDNAVYTITGQRVN